jgi:hypothetical protein
VIIGEKASRILNVTNTGTASMTITNVILPDGFTSDAEEVDGVIVATIYFEPDAAKEFNGEIIIESNATSGTNTIAITGTGVPITALEKQLSDQLQLFPNPASDWLIVQGADFKGVSVVTITDEKGATLQAAAEGNEIEMKVNVSTLTGGLYIIGVPVSGTVVQKKFSKN